MGMPALWSRKLIACAWRRSRPIGTACRSTRCGLGSSCIRPTGSRWRKWPRGPGSAGRRCGAGNSFANAGVDALLRDQTRKPPTADATVHQMVALTCSEPPGEAKHWTGRAMAQAMGLSLRTVQGSGPRSNLQPHRVRSSKRSRDPDFASKLEAIVGLYAAAPRHDVVLSVDEKSQIQTLDRTQRACR